MRNDAVTVECRHRNRGERMDPTRQCATAPNDSVIDANSKSVPTAIAGGMPNPPTRIGVINEPPPTPVKPMMMPMANPMAGK